MGGNDSRPFGLDPEGAALISPGQRPGYLWPSRYRTLKGCDERGWRNMDAATPPQGRRDACTTNGVHSSQIVFCYI
jgi:hypothetical protein